MTSFAKKTLQLRDVQSQLDRALDICFLALLFFAPLLMGGRHPVGRIVYVVLISLALIIWTIRQAIDPAAKLRKSGAEWLLLLGLAIPIVQLVHLPQSWLVTIAPNLPGLLPTWFEGGSQVAADSWSQLSLCPQVTRDALAMYLAYATLFFLAVQRIKSLKDIERLLRWIALAAVALAVLGIAQMLLSNGKFLWVYEHPSRDTFGKVKGPFANENHFAHFLALGIGPLVWWMWREKNSRSHSKSVGRGGRKQQSSAGRPTSRSASGRSRSSFSSTSHRALNKRREHMHTLLWLAMLVIAIAGLLTFSRGGVLVVGLAATLAVTTYVLSRLFDRRSLLVLAGLGTVVVAAMFIHGLDRLSGELESVTAGSIDKLDKESARRKLWAADVQAFRDFALLGTGAATHREVYPTYYSDYHVVEYTHAESGYVGILMECGLAGIAALVLALGFCLVWGYRCFVGNSDRHVRAILLAISAGLLASIVHSIWDFVWYIPACITLTLLQIACLCRLSQLCRTRKTSEADSSCTDTTRGEAALLPNGAKQTSSRQNRKVRWSWVLAASVLAVGSFQMIKCLYPAARAASSWDRYAMLVFATKGEADSANPQESIVAAIPALEAAYKSDPNNARVNLKLAALYLLQFEAKQRSASNPMTLDEIRQATVASSFSSVQQQNEWLARAVGGNRLYLLKARYFARRAARLSPLQGEAYVHLSRLDFLRGGDSKSSSALIKQAVRVRPGHGGVLLAAAVDAAVQEDVTAAMDYFRRAFRQGPDFQRRVIEMLAASLPSDAFMNEFEPDLDGLRQLFDYYQEAERREDAEAIAGSYLQQLESKAATESSETAARLWYQAHVVYEYVNDEDRMLTSLKRAVEIRPADFGLRKAYAIKLANFGTNEAAAEQLRWCLRRKPDDATLKHILTRITTEEMRKSDIAELPDENTSYR